MRSSSSGGKLADARCQSPVLAYGLIPRFLFSVIMDDALVSACHCVNEGEILGRTAG
jgi:hypothetical protein